jgi:RNA polymerase sigma-70 factor (ECF subfamily)
MSNALMRAMPIMLDEGRESDLVARVQRGAAPQREAAFGELFREFRGPVFALCLHLTGNVSDAEDALQEVFLAIHQGIGQFRSESRLFTWIYRIAIRTALRVKASRPKESTELEVDSVATTEDDPIVTREVSERVFFALSRLSADHRVVISLFAIEGLSHKEIAAILGVPEGTVWSRLHHARKNLASLLQDENDTDAGEALRNSSRAEAAKSERQTPFR